MKPSQDRTSPATGLTYEQEVEYDDARRKILEARRDYERAQESLKELAAWYDPVRLEATANDLALALLQEIDAWKKLVVTLKRLKGAE